MRLDLIGFLELIANAPEDVFSSSKRCIPIGSSARNGSFSNDYNLFDRFTESLAWVHSSMTS